MLLRAAYDGVLKSSVIDCSRMPPDIVGMRKYLEEYIIPD